MVPSVYFFYPETAYRSLEEMDSIFHKLQPGWAGVLGAVRQAEVEPRRYGKHGEVLIDYSDTEEARAHGRGRTAEAGADRGAADDKASASHSNGSGDDVRKAPSGDGVRVQHDEEKR